MEPSIRAPPCLCLPLRGTPELGSAPGCDRSVRHLALRGPCEGRITAVLLWVPIPSGATHQAGRGGHDHSDESSPSEAGRRTRGGRFGPRVLPAAGRMRTSSDHGGPSVSLQGIEPSPPPQSPPRQASLSSRSLCGAGSPTGGAGQSLKPAIPEAP